MTVYEINSCNYGSTGNIMLQIAQKGNSENLTVISCFPASRSNAKKEVSQELVIGNRLSRNVHLLMAHFTGLNGCYSIWETHRFLRKLKRDNTEVIHLHNLHNCYINLPMLFHFIKKNNIPVVWTLHDCWAFTGHCPHFTITKCNKWKTGCCKCPSYRDYPGSFFDNSKFMWKLKKAWFTGVGNLTIVAPSQWLADLVKQSFLRDYPVKVINNGIDLSVFKPTLSDFRERYHIQAEKKLLLGVAFGWSFRKGLDVFIELSKCLSREEYQIVLVGTDDVVDKLLPGNIISIHRTQNQLELAEIYSAADLLVNPTREDNFPTVNIEALACGTPVATFKTGGSPEIIDENCGIVLSEQNYIFEIKQFQKSHFLSEDCQKRAKNYDQGRVQRAYIELYKSLSLKT